MNRVDTATAEQPPFWEPDIANENGAPSRYTGDPWGIDFDVDQPNCAVPVGRTGLYQPPSADDGLETVKSQVEFEIARAEITAPEIDPIASAEKSARATSILEDFTEEELAAERARIEIAKSTPKKHDIYIEAGELTKAINEAEIALIANCRGLFQRGPMIVRSCKTKIKIADGKEIDGNRLVQVRHHNLREHMGMSAKFWKYDVRKADYLPRDCPMEIAEAYIERVGAWNLRPLLGVINAPTLRSDGSILQLPGYDEVTGLLFDPAGQDFAIIDENPSQEDALLAVTTLKTAIETYPFVSDADRSVALSGILTALIRGSIATVPLHGFSAPTPGTGKSALVDIASIISAGHEAAVISPGGTEEELQKRLQSSILAGDLLISIDNCDDEIGGAFFCQMLTQTMLKIRVLGKSVNIELRSNSTIFATGNNLRVDGDMSRRTLISSLDAGCENPELRVFEFDPLERAKSNRSALVSAGLTILRAYHVAGRPAPAFPSLGSFNQWSDWIRSALIWCGEADPCDTMEKVRQTDPKRDALGAALALWNAAVGQRRVSVKECISAASSCAHADFRDALLMVAGDGSDINPLRLGKWLSKHAGRPINGLKFVPDGILAGSQQWRVSQV